LNSGLPYSRPAHYQLSYVAPFSKIFTFSFLNNFRGKTEILYPQVEELSPTLKVQTDVALILQPFFAPDGLVAKSLEFAATQVSFQDYFQEVFLSPRLIRNVGSI
jgi:hypothetical protein